MFPLTKSSAVDVEVPETEPRPRKRRTKKKKDVPTCGADSDDEKADAMQKPDHDLRGDIANLDLGTNTVTFYSLFPLHGIIRHPANLDAMGAFIRQYTHTDGEDEDTFLFHSANGVLESSVRCNDRRAKVASRCLSAISDVLYGKDRREAGRIIVTDDSRYLPVVGARVANLHNGGVLYVDTELTEMTTKYSRLRYPDRVLNNLIAEVRDDQSVVRDDVSIACLDLDYVLVEDIENILGTKCFTYPRTDFILISMKALWIERYARYRYKRVLAIRKTLLGLRKRMSGDGGDAHIMHFAKGLYDVFIIAITDANMWSSTVIDRANALVNEMAKKERKSYIAALKARWNKAVGDDKDKIKSIIDDLSAKGDEPLITLVQEEKPAVRRRRGGGKSNSDGQENKGEVMKRTRGRTPSSKSREVEVRDESPVKARKPSKRQPPPRKQRQKPIAKKNAKQRRK